MDIEQMIKKWDEQIALHRRVCDDPLMYTKEERLKNSHYAQAICAVLADLKKVKNLSSNTVLADSDFWVECDVCKTQLKNWTGSTPCCGSIAWLVEDGKPTKKLSLFASIGGEPFKPTIVNVGG